MITDLQFIERKQEIELIEKIFGGCYVNPRQITKIYFHTCIDTYRGDQTGFVFPILIIGWKEAKDSCEYEDDNECENDREMLVEIVHSYK